jgi:hypothetical protein
MIKILKKNVGTFEYLRYIDFKNTSYYMILNSIFIKLNSDLNLKICIDITNSY